MSIEIRKVTPVLPSRPCRWCLGLQDDSVFADFDIDNDGRVFLARISFDAYGCCRIENEMRRMDAEMSRRFLDLIETDEVGSSEMAAVISRYFRDNSDVIWKDALDDHGLLDD